MGNDSLSFELEAADCSSLRKDREKPRAPYFSCVRRSETDGGGPTSGRRSGPQECGGNTRRVGPRPDHLSSRRGGRLSRDIAGGRERTRRITEESVELADRRRGGRHDRADDEEDGDITRPEVGGGGAREEAARHRAREEELLAELETARGRIVELETEVQRLQRVAAAESAALHGEVSRLEERVRREKEIFSIMANEL